MKFTKLKPKLVFTLALFMCLTTTLYAAVGCAMTVTVTGADYAYINWGNGTSMILDNMATNQIGDSNMVTVIVTNCAFMGPHGIVGPTVTATLWIDWNHTGVMQPVATSQVVMQPGADQLSCFFVANVCTSINSYVPSQIFACEQ